MTTDDSSEKQTNHLCEKCGSSMSKRILAVNESPNLDFVNIYQCNVCRHYYIYEPELKKPKQDREIIENRSLILNKAYGLGMKYEQECTGCAQATIAAIFEALGIWSDAVFKSASGLSNGLGLTGKGTRAALLGASMVIGYLFGRAHDNFNDFYKGMKSYALIKRLHNLFRRKYSKCLCRDVQKELLGLTWNYTELDKINSIYRKQMVLACSKLVGDVAKTATMIILENGFTPSNK